MILECSQSLRGCLIVWALTLASTLTHLPRHCPSPPLSFVCLLACSPGFLPQSPFPISFPISRQLWNIALFSFFHFFHSSVVTACPKSYSHWQSHELSRSCLPFQCRGWLSSACQSPWWSLADVHYNLLGAVILPYISHLTSLLCCLLKSRDFMCSHADLLNGAWLVCQSGCW